MKSSRPYRMGKAQNGREEFDLVRKNKDTLAFETRLTRYVPALLTCV